MCQNQDQHCDCLTKRTEQEADRDCIRRTERIGNCAVNTRHCTRQKLVGDTLERSGKLSNHRADTKLQDSKICCKRQCRAQHIEEEAVRFLHETEFHDISLADNNEDNSEEEQHDQRCADHIIIEDLHPARQLDIFETSAPEG